MGKVEGNWELISSTEQLVGDSASWKTTTSLPRAAKGLAGVTLDNTVYMTGLCGALYKGIIYTFFQAAGAAIIRGRSWPGVATGRTGWSWGS